MIKKINKIEIIKSSHLGLDGNLENHLHLFIDEKIRHIIVEHWSRQTFLQIGKSYIFLNYCFVSRYLRKG